MRFSVRSARRLIIQFVKQDMSSSSSSGAAGVTKKGVTKKGVTEEEAVVTNIDSDVMFARFRRCIPRLNSDMHKGQAGRIGVVGGCKEYTGAPYYAAISSLKAGADLSHVYCMEAAASVIKSYSPELIVHPVLDHPSIEDEVTPWLQKMHALVVGPGLGRSFSLMSPAKIIVHKAIELGIPLVLDADGIYLISCDPELVRGYRNCILTPNKVEFKLLYSRVFGTAWNEEEDLTDSVARLSQRLDHVTVCLKDRVDVISDGRATCKVTEEGSPRRCGGQGDVLAGAAGTFFHWAKTFDGYDDDDAHDDDGAKAKASPPMLAAYGACVLTKRCNAKSFSLRGRSTTTVDLIDNIGAVFMESFES